MGTEHAPVSQPQVTPAAPSRDLDHDEARHEGPTDAALGWAPKGKKQPVSSADVQRQKLDGARESTQAAEAAVIALAGRLDGAAAQIEKLISTPADAAGPGVRILAVEEELRHVSRAHEFLHVEKVTAMHQVGLAAFGLLTSSEARLTSAIKRAETFAKSNHQTLNVDGPLQEVHRMIDTILKSKNVERAQLGTVPASATSSPDLAILAVKEQLDAALARVRFLSMGLAVARDDELHTAIEQYTAHMNAANSAAGAILGDRKTSKGPKASRGATKEAKDVMKVLATELVALLLSATKTPRAAAQTKWSDLKVMLNVTSKTMKSL